MLDSNYEVADRIEVLEAFTTDDQGEHALWVETGEWGTLLSADDGWLHIDFDKDAALSHWVEQQNSMKLRLHSAASLPTAEAAVPQETHSELCLVLDIDGTLLSEAITGELTDLRQHLRPHLHYFLDFAFDHFRGVALWTAAGSEHLNNFLAAVDPQGVRPWAFVWNGRLSFIRSCASSLYEGMYPRRQPVKRLRKIWNKKCLRALGFNRHSTLIVENTPARCEDNYGNAVYVDTYWGGQDDVLPQLCVYLKRLSEQLQGQGPDGFHASVRSVEKRSWFQAMACT